LISLLLSVFDSKLFKLFKGVLIEDSTLEVHKGVDDKLLLRLLLDLKNGLQFLLLNEIQGLSVKFES